MAAKHKLIEQKQSGVVKAYQVDETKDKMVAGEAALAADVVRRRAVRH